MPIPSHVTTVSELEAIAAERLSPTAAAFFGYVAERGLTARRERDALDTVLLRTRAMIDGSVTSTGCTLLGHELALPVIAAPSAQHGLAHPEAEAATVAGCARAGSLACVAMGSTLPLPAYGRQDVAWWQQLYTTPDRARTEAFVAAAREHGASALVVTADVPIPAARPALTDDENVFGLPETLGLAGDRITDWSPRLAGHNVTWDDLDWMRELAGDLPLVVKGVLDVDDATRLADAGADAIVVSTHGGRQLDGTAAPIEVLPAIVEAVAGRCRLLVDGSVRSGTDVLKLLARGADAVMLGRPIVWGLAADGAAGVQWVLDTIQRELVVALAMTGCTGPGDVTPDIELRL